MGVTQWLDVWARNAMPGLSVLLLILGTAVPLGFPAMPEITPAWSLMAVFYWATYRPDLLPPMLVFAAGLLQDALTGMPFGLSAAMLLLTRVAADSQRAAIAGRSLLFLSLNFVVIAAGVAMLSGALISLLALKSAFTLAAAQQFLLTIGLFPMAGWLFARLHRAVLV